VASPRDHEGAIVTTYDAPMTEKETGAFIIWLLLIVIVAVVLDGGLIAGAVMALVGIAMGFIAVRRRRPSGPA